MKRIFLSIVILCLFLSGCTEPEDFIENVPFPETAELLHEEDVKNGRVVLYYDENGFRMAFYSYSKKNWNQTGNTELEPEEGLSWAMSNDPTVPVTIFAGVITDEKVDRVIVKQKTMKQKANIVDAKGKRVWFTIFDILESSGPGEPDPLKIEAYDANSNIIWKNGVYEDGSFSGRTD